MFWKKKKKSGFKDDLILTVARITMQNSPFVFTLTVELAQCYYSPGTEIF